jgi:hypothetical protein
MEEFVPAQGKAKTKGEATNKTEQFLYETVRATRKGSFMNVSRLKFR